MSLIAFAILPLAPPLRSRAQGPPTTYTFTDLGVLGTGTISRARGISSCGVVVGETNVILNGQVHPFVWKDGVMKDIAPSSTGTAAAINSAGFVVGEVADVAFIWHDDNGDGNPDASERVSLGMLPGDQYSDAFDINETNQIVGLSGADLEDRGFSWLQGAMQVIPTDNSVTPIWGTGINNAGHIAGVGNVTSGETHAYLRKGSSNIDLRTRGGTVSIAYDVNESEYAVGLSRIAGNVLVHAFIWHDDNGNGVTDGCEPLTVGCEMRDLGTLGGSTSAAFDINASNVVVGYAEISGGGSHAFAYDGTMRDLNTPGVVTNLPVGWVLERANAINDSGQIVGYGTIGGQTHAFLLTPTGVTPPPCPSALPTVSVSVSPSSVSEDGATNLVYTFTRSMTAGSLTANFSVGGTADFTTDYSQSGAASFTASTGSVTFAAGNSQATVTIDPGTDSTVESDETVNLTLTANAAYTIGIPSNAGGTISNDDTDVIVTLTPMTVTESGATNLVYTFTRTGVTTGALTVSFSVASGAGTATFGNDYTQTGAATFSSSSGTVTIGAGNPSATVTIDPATDSILDGDETVTLTVTSGSGYNVASPTAATGTITPDAPVIFTEEGNGNFAVAVNSVTFARGPFRLVDNLNFGADKLTRIILVTSNLGITNADLATGIFSIHIAGYGQIPLANIEHVGPITGVAGLNASYIIVKLPANLSNPAPGPNNLTLTVKMGSAESNLTTLSIVP